ncbi:TetR family transcriptional regulator [Thermosipho sp. 1063]|uniref:TetR/AcrR family transcriptional regulator n=1 Tax=unclassified Thermosipho (in: thermotogales) TaxID=2676525 RepID=UPI000949295C|nr:MULTISPECIES: TetR/AcrR family transcriptional regulator [unclassified Thermosipho (in: thermotogales)]ANQ53481.1 TetR family transcriptional regulator [Thermosipho sp. 1070]APT71930.1 TetR family transcriptional regulator [Thermosipho sp. 1063]
MKNKIIEVAIKEFAKKGFFAASTNTISTNAHVSKGAIFYHFKSKENLYLICFKSIISLFEKELDLFLKKNPNLDFFNLILKWSKKKIEIINKQKYILDFLETTKNLPKSLEEKIQTILRENYTKYMPVLREKFEKVELKEGLDREFTFSIVLDFFDTFSRRYNNTSYIPDKMLSEFENVIKIIKYGISKY